MARAPERDLVGLTVLALLRVKPSHPYEMHRMVIDTHKDFVTGLPRSLYHAVDRLAKDELITPVETTREGRRPERTLYELTGEGCAELASRLRRLIEAPLTDSQPFMAALSFIGVLARGEATAALQARVTALEGQVANAEALLAGLRKTLPELLIVELDYRRAQLTSDLAFTRDLLTRVDGGAIAWPDDLATWAADLPVPETSKSARPPAAKPSAAEPPTEKPPTTEG